MQEDEIEVSGTTPFEEPVKTQKITKETIEISNPFFDDFGVTEENNTIENTPFDIETPYRAFKAGNRSLPWPEGILVNVVSNTYVSKDFTLLEGIVTEGKDRPTVDQVTPDSLRHVLEFKFSDINGIQNATLTIFDIASNDAKLAKKKKGMMDTIGHIWDAITMAPGSAAKYLSPAAIKAANGDKPITSWQANWETIALIFNTAKKGKPIYQDSDGNPFLLRLRLSYNSNGRIEFPMYGNKIERIPSDITLPSTLVIRNTDRFTRPEAATGLIPAEDVTKSATPDGEWGEAFD